MDSFAKPILPPNGPCPEEKEGCLINLPRPSKVERLAFQLAKPFKSRSMIPEWIYGLPRNNNDHQKWIYGLVTDLASVILGKGPDLDGLTKVALAYAVFPLAMGVACGVPSSRPGSLSPQEVESGLPAKPRV